MLKKLVLCTLVLGMGVAQASAGVEALAKPEIVKQEVKQQLLRSPVEPLRQGGDTFGTATVIPGLPFTATGETYSYTNDYDETCPYTGSVAPDVVYLFSPLDDVNINATLCEDITDYDSKLYIYNSALEVVACNDDACTSPYYGDAYVSALYNTFLMGGDAYYIVIDGYGSSSGSYQLNVTSAAIGGSYCDGYGQEPASPEGDWMAATSHYDEGVVNLQRAESFTADRPIVGLWVTGLMMVFSDTYGWSFCEETSPKALTLTFYTNSSGFPGSPLWTSQVDATFTPNGDEYSGYPAYDFYLPIENSLAMADGFVSIQSGDTGNGCWFLWMSSHDGEGASAVRADGGDWTTYDHDLNYCLVLQEPEPGENCDVALPIEAFPFMDFGNTCDFMDDGYTVPSEDVVYSFTLDSFSEGFIDLCGSTFDTYLTLLDDDCSTVIASNDDFCFVQSMLNFPSQNPYENPVDGCLPPGSYYIVVEGYWDDCGDYDLIVDFWDCPTTDIEPVDYALKANYPNPFNPVTSIEFTLAEPGVTHLEVFNLLGERVATLIDGDLPMGEHSVRFDASDLASGVYLYTLRSGDYARTRKLTLLK